jgi:triphosphatase
MTVPGVNLEVELKLAPLRGTLRDIGRTLVRAGARHSGQRKTIRSVYFDTDDLRLHDSGYFLRIRHNEPDNIQTVKATKPANGGLGRGEWEAKVPADRPVAEAAAGSPLAKLLHKPKDWEKLQPIFTVEVGRDIYLLDRGETMIEVALDEGVVRNERGEQSVTEAELELKKGDPRSLFAFARAIVAAVPCVVSLTSKGERGYRLLTGEASRPATSLEFSLRQDISTPEAVHTIYHTCLTALFDNLSMLIANGGVEALHQSRVCLRRLRAILSLFSSALTLRGGMASLRDELRWLSGLLRPAREFDVLIKSVLGPTAAANTDIAGFEPMLAAFQARRDQANATILDNLRSRRLSELSLNLASQLIVPVPVNSPTSEVEGQRPAGRFVAKELRRRLKSLLQDSRGIEKLGPPEQHRIRLRAKKLRYMIEPFADLIPHKRFHEIVSSLHGIQDGLGDLNDCKVNRELLLAYAKELLAGDQAQHVSLIPAGLAMGACMARKATALSKAAAARERLASASALRVG